MKIGGGRTDLLRGEEEVSIFTYSSEGGRVLEEHPGNSCMTLIWADNVIRVGDWETAWEVGSRGYLISIELTDNFRSRWSRRFTGEMIWEASGADKLHCRRRVAISDCKVSKVIYIVETCFWSNRFCCCRSAFLCNAVANLSFSFAFVPFIKAHLNNIAIVAFARVTLIKLS